MTDKENVLIITYHKNAYFYPFIKSNNIIIKEPIKNKNMITRILFKIPFFSSLVYDFKKELETCNKIILFDSAYNWALGFYLIKIRHINNVYLYYWNPIKKMYPRNGKKMVLAAKKLMKVYSFDHNDCKLYTLNYASMVYSNDVILNTKNNDSDIMQYDVFFLGCKKDRYEYLLQLYNTYIKDKLQAKIIVIGAKNNKDFNKDFTFSEKRYEYNEYLTFVSKSKAILDIPQDGQEGLTMRNVESIFLKKKLITTKKDIKNYDFYNRNNIFILGEDDPDTLIEFVHSEYQDISWNIKKNYELEYWIKQFK